VGGFCQDDRIPSGELAIFAIDSHIDKLYTSEAPQGVKKAAGS